MSESSQAQTATNPLQANKGRLEREIQESVNRLDIALIEEEADVRTLRYRICTEGYELNTDIAHRPLAAMRRDLRELLDKYEMLCTILSEVPRKFFPEPEKPEEASEEETAPLRLV